MHLKCKDWKGFWRKRRLQRCSNGQVTKISARSPKPRIFWKTAKGDQGKLFKNRPKKSPRLKGPKALWRKCHYPFISMHLNCEDLKTFWRKQRLQKCPNRQVMAILARSPKPAFSEKVQRGDQRKFFKNRPKSSPRLKGQKQSGANGIILLKVCK